MSLKKTSLLKRIAELSNTFSPKQRIFAEYLVQNYMSLAYSTLSELGHLAGVSETTVTRFIYTVGYNGQAEFMEALREEIERSRQTSTEGMKRYSMEQGNYEFPRDTYRAIFSLEMHIIEETMDKIDPDHFQRAVDAIFAAPAMLIVACGSNRCYSQAAGFAFEVLRPNVRKIENLDISEGAVIGSIPPGTVALVFSAPRYPSTVQKILEIMKENNPFLIGVTDSVLSPIAPYCDILFQVPEKFVTFIDTNAAYVALIHALAFGVYLKDPDYSKKRIEKYDLFVKRSNYYTQNHLKLIEF